MIFSFMKSHVNIYPVENMAKVLGVTRAGYYKYMGSTEPATKTKNKDLLDKIKAISKGKRQTYGTPASMKNLLSKVRSVRAKGLQES